MNRHTHTHTHERNLNSLQTFTIIPPSAVILQCSITQGPAWFFFPSPSPVAPSTATSGFHKHIHVLAKWERRGEEGGRACVVDHEEAWVWTSSRAAEPVCSSGGGSASPSQSRQAVADAYEEVGNTDCSQGVRKREKKRARKGREEKPKSGEDVEVGDTCRDQRGHIRGGL